ncbi:MAG: glycosyltransferase [Pseudomonadota bacterium]
MKVMIVVTHLLGTGHLSRTLTLARGMQAAGQQVVLVSGGMPVDHLSMNGVPWVQLPAIRSDGIRFTQLLDEHGAEVSPAFMLRRQAALLSTFARIAPDVLVTELFPFGRRMLRTEFLALLDTAKVAGTKVAASVRDILNPPSTPAKADWADEIVGRYYDTVLVHADPGIVELDASWPVRHPLSERVVYTGFVAPNPPGQHPERAGEDEILVSAGGGAVGGPLFAAARAAAEVDGTRHWRLFLGGADAIDRIADLAHGAPANLSVEPARRDFREMLQGAAASVSLCGYNTALDVLQSGVPAVFVPFDTGGEAEQQLRAGALARLPGIEVLQSSALNERTLADTLRRAITAPRRAPLRDGVDGASVSAKVLADLAKRQQA